MEFLAEVKQALEEKKEGDLVLGNLKDGVLEIVLNRPKKYNALNLEMYKAIEKLLTEGNKNPEVKVVLLYANGPNYSTGNDLSNFLLFPEVISEKEKREVLVKFMAEDVLYSFSKAVVGFTKPIMACVHGLCIGVAFTTLALCDIVYATENTSFHAPLVQLAQGPEMCSAYTFPRVFGGSKAGELLYLGEKMSGNEALQYKLVSKLFKNQEDMMKVARENAKKVAELDYESMLACKSLIKSTNNDEINKVMRKEIDNLIVRWNADALFGVIANFMQRPKSKL